jgi:bifunctional non-homologous end joining protein LigD
VSGATVRAGRRAVDISSPDKVLFPRAGITKLELASYYARVAPAMVPLVRDRPVTIHAYPAGIEREGIFIKSAPRHFPDWVPRAEMRKRGGTVTHALANDAAVLVYLAGQNCVTPHIWLSRVDEPDKPDRVIFDLDPPPGSGFADVRAAARSLGEMLRDRGLATYAMVTGSKGVHVVVPIRRRAEFPEVFRWAKAVGEELAASNPRKLTLEFLKDNREGRIYVDVRRNAYAQHAVAPYAVRPRENAPVALPIHWDELSDGRLKPDSWTMRTAPERLESDGDAWQGMGRHAKLLPRLAEAKG